MGVISTAQGFSIKKWMTDDSYFNISEMKQSITSLYILSDAPKFDIIWTEKSDAIDSLIPEILMFEESSKRVQLLDTLWTSISPEGNNQSDFRFQSN